jgi:hypothetical protein
LELNSNILKSQIIQQPLLFFNQGRRRERDFSAVSTRAHGGCISQ